MELLSMGQETVLKDTSKVLLMSQKQQMQLNNGQTLPVKYSWDSVYASESWHHTEVITQWTSQSLWIVLSFQWATALSVSSLDSQSGLLLVTSPSWVN
jgi:hypothetical protein